MHRWTEARTKSNSVDFDFYKSFCQFLSLILVWSAGALWSRDSALDIYIEMLLQDRKHVKTQTDRILLSQTFFSWVSSACLPSHLPGHNDVEILPRLALPHDHLVVLEGDGDQAVRYGHPLPIIKVF